MDSSKSAATTAPKHLTGDRFCAASIDGHPIRIEYLVGNDEDGPWVAVVAVHMGGKRIKAHWFDADALNDWERECEAVEITADEGMAEPRNTCSRGMYVVAGVAA